MTSNQYWDFKYIKRRLIMSRDRIKRHPIYRFWAGSVFLLALIIVLAIGLSFYRLVKVPPRSKIIAEETKQQVSEQVMGETTQEWQEYSNQNYRFSLKLPSGAQKTDLPMGNGAIFNLDENQTVKVFAEKTNGDTTINEYLEIAKGRVSENKVKEIETKYDSLINMTAINQVWEYQFEGKEMREKRIVGLKSGYFYNLAFTSPRNTFEKGLEKFDIIVQGFKTY